MAIKPNDDLFRSIVENAPLVSIDLIIKNSKGDYLLNYRGRHPAYHKWFFFGGSIKKPEKPEESFNRIVDREFFSKLKIDFKNIQFTKLAVHRYKENLDGEFNTFEQGIQYYVLCYEFITELSENDIAYLTQKYVESARIKEEEIKDKIADEKAKNEVHIEPEAIQIGWYCQEQIKALKEVHPYVLDYFTNSTETIITPYQTNIDSKELLVLYQTQSKSLNNYTTVIWAFPIAFVLALGTIYRYFYDNILALIISIGFAAVLLHAFYKHTYIHELLVTSVNAIEKSLKQKYQLDNGIIPNWDLTKKTFNFQSHILVRKFLLVFTILYSAIALFKSIIMFDQWVLNNLIELTHKMKFFFN